MPFSQVLESKGEVQVAEEWVEVDTLAHLGNNWVMKKPASTTPRAMTVRITSHGGTVYGVYEVVFTCDEECKAAPGLDAPSTKITDAKLCSIDGNTCSV